MNEQKYKRFRVLVTIFVSTLVGMAAVRDSYLLAAAAVASGMLFMILVRSRTKVKIDEREKTVREKAARLTYAIFAPTLGIGSFLMLIPSRSDLFPVFAKGDFVYLESLGVVFAYLTLFLITLYAISFHYINRKMGGSTREE